MYRDRVPESDEEKGLSRRQFIGRTGAGAAAVAVPGLLAACGGSSHHSATTSTTASTTAATPRKGGHITVGIIGNGTAETFDPNLLNSPSDAHRCYCVFDPFTRPGPSFTTQPGLVETWTPNSDGTLWELKLREGVVWHDGKPFTADDIIYTFRRMAAPSSLGRGAVLNMKLRDLKKLGDHIVQVPLLAPNGRLQDAFVTLNSTFVVQDGATDFTKPVGTGPFKLQSFTPGQTTVFTRNPDYWDDGKPYLDGQTMTDIADDNARLNALQSGQVDICTPLAFTLATSNQSNSAIKLLTAVGGPGQYIYMRVDTPPFNDVRVRQAMKLIADRPQLIATAFSGHGRVANDMPGPGLPDYDTSLPQRVQDIEQAKLLLKSAGRSDLRVTLQTAPVAEGIVEAATLYAQQAAKAGVTVNVKQDLPSSYFSPKLLYLKMPLAQDTWPTGSLSYIYETILRSTSGANETHWHNAESDKLLTQAEGAVNPAQRQALWNKVQALQYNEGGNIIWASRLSVDALAPHVQGVNTKGWLYGLGDRNVWDWWVSA